MKPRAWSHTTLSQFKNCPRQYHEVKVLKRFVEEQGEQLLWGNRVHTACENYLNGTPGDVLLNEDMLIYKPYLDAILQVKGDMYVEHEMNLDSNLNPCDKFAKNVFVRGIADVLHVRDGTARVMDHKTGKRKPDSKQMKLMALLTFAHFPTVDRVRIGFFWLKTAEKDTLWYTRSEIAALWQEFLPDLAQWKEAFITDVWQPRSSGLCHGWCPVTSCEFWKPKRPRK